MAQETEQMIEPERFIELVSECALVSGIPSSYELDESACIDVSCHNCDLHALLNMFRGNERVYMIRFPDCINEGE